MHRIGPNNPVNLPHLKVHQLIKAPANFVARRHSQPITLGFGSTDEGRVQHVEHVVRVHLDILEPSNVAKNIFISTTINYHQLPSTTINIHQLPNGSGKTFLSHIPLVQQKTTTLQRGAITAIRSAGSAGLAGLCSTLHHFRGLSRSLSGGSPGSSLGGEIPDISVVM